MKKLLICLLLCCSCAGPKIIDKPIVFDENRKQLSLQYLEERYDLEQEEPKIDPKMIVLHWTAIPDLERSFNAFKDPELPGHRSEISGAGSLNVSAHFLIDRDGSIYRLMPETTMARHVIGLNHVAIGVENVGGTADTPLTEAQLKANIKLVKYLKKKYDIEYLLGHYEYTNFEDHELWLEVDEGYRTQKTDPGNDFMAEIRKAVKNLNFKPVPKN
ncbi:N-acetylmuramoyl-L-alanine amidase [Gramella sp. KN1008]|uniref:N-acetylmuramoyl-L-alanine amidase n=1 Tax=Gramella sp. KN1008 TaxID=2529298 RepID=UPI00103CFBD8|nr:peptidoglycan recognition family protein [Gramella sp. KN1008]TBW27512.1 N-acetylmuramoyl-L-alanine amidase [Gramella sp. KN1008]